jgi:phosphoribosylanthranilate isomerase
MAGAAAARYAGVADGMGQNDALGCKVKLCGLKREQDVDAAIAAGPDAVGFIIDVPGSHRSVSPERAAELVERLRSKADETHRKKPCAVGVFVNQPAQTVADVVREAVLDVVQLHGGEDAQYIAGLRALVDVPMMQAFTVRSEGDVAHAVESPADMILLDAGSGDGRTFDWSLAQGVRRPFILAGGLAADNVARAIAATHPFGVDLSSGIETNGLKDPGKMASVVAAVRKASGEIGDCHQRE